MVRKSYFMISRELKDMEGVATIYANAILDIEEIVKGELPSVLKLNAIKDVINVLRGDDE